jgi:thiol:disulfide interchange protein
VLLLVLAGVFSTLEATLAVKLTFALLALLGVVQLAYLVPIGRRLRARGQSQTLQGVIIGGALTLLLTAACAGPVLSNLFAD